MFLNYKFWYNKVINNIKICDFIQIFNLKVYKKIIMFIYLLVLLVIILTTRRNFVKNVQISDINIYNLIHFNCKIFCEVLRF